MSKTVIETATVKLALEALQKIYISPEREEYIRVWWPACEQAITALREALAEQPAPVQEPLATLFGSLPVYDTTPQAQPAQPLTDEQIKDVAASCMWWVREQDILDDAIELARAIEAAHGIKENT